MAAFSHRAVDGGKKSHHARALYRAPIFALGEVLARALPLRMLRAFAAMLGAAYAWMHPAKVKVVRQNLRLLDPAIPARTARRVYAEFAMTLVDYFYIGTRLPAEAVKIIGQIEGEQHLAEAHRAGKGALVVTGHLGLFELGGLLMGQSGFPSAALTLPEPSRELTQWRAEFRQRWGVETIEIGTDEFAFLEIGRKLRAGHFVATLIDRPHPQESVPVQLSHGMAGFSTGILLLAAHCGAPVIPATMVRTASGLYRAQVFAPIRIENRGSRAETLAFYSQKIADILSPVLCTHPEQWYQFVPLSPSR